MQQEANHAIRHLFGKAAGIAPDVDGGGVAKAAASGSDPLDQLKKLAELRDSDAITAAEYEEHKRLLLAKLSRDAAE